MAYTTINKSGLYFNTKLYSGNGTTNHNITGVGFQPDLVWTKGRSGSYGVSNHKLADAVRGAGKIIHANMSDAEYDQSGATGATIGFISDGFTLGTNSNSNNSSTEYVSWNWKANGQGSSNTDGSINTTYTSVNTTSGFSISTYTGTGSSATIGHGLGASPDVVIIKKTNVAEDWNFQTSAIGYGNYLVLNGTGASASAGGGLVSAVSSTTVTVDSNSYVNSSGATYVMYCFAEKKGYSKFGYYHGNGVADGSFVYTGFKPAFAIVKCTSHNGESWWMGDNKRPGYNVSQKALLAESNAAEVDASYQAVDFLSNGIKWRGANDRVNNSGKTYIYMAFGQSLVGSNNVPCTAR